MRQNFRMIDVGEKSETRRRAIASGVIKLSSQTIEMIKAGDSPKGDILSIAEVAGIMAAKRTSEILPLCHPLALEAVFVRFEIQEGQMQVECEVLCSGKTGAEMEALMGVNVSLLTIYDLAKAVDPLIEIQDVHLQRKEGGKSGLWLNPKAKQNLAKASELGAAHAKDLDYHGLRVAIGVLSDRASRGEYEDQSGVVMRDFLKTVNAHEALYSVVPDEDEAIRNLVHRALKERAEVLLLTGGTGISSRDRTPEVIQSMASKELPGFGEIQRQHGARYTKNSWLSRSSAFVVENALVVLFPGSPKAVRQGLECLGDLIPHAVRMMQDLGHGPDHQLLRGPK